MSKKLPSECQVIKLVDYMGFKYKLAVQSIGHKSKRINELEWIRFVESYKNKNIEKLCLKKLKEVKFEISVLNNEGLEVRKDASGKDYILGCLIQAEEETYYKQVKIDTLFLYIVSVSFGLRLKIDNLVAKVHVPKHSSKVDVYYIFTPENLKRLAVGFMGSGWTTFCFENDIEESCQLFFQWMGCTPEDHFNFTVKIFNKDEIGLHMGTKHHCCRSNHQYHKRHPHYKKQFEYHVIRTHNLYILWRMNNQIKNLLLLMIPKKFVREHQLNKYGSAVLSFGYVKFLVQLLLRRDPRKADDNTHLVMYSNW
ncbi:putative DNA-binding pseudobarrel domain superfamily [Helianthus anomalus]